MFNHRTIQDASSELCYLTYVHSNAFSEVSVSVSGDAKKVLKIQFEEEGNNERPITNWGRSRTLKAFYT